MVRKRMSSPKLTTATWFPDARDREDAEGTSDSLDRHAEEGNAFIVDGSGRADVVREQRMFGNVFRHERHLAGEDAGTSCGRSAAPCSIAIGDRQAAATIDSAPSSPTMATTPRRISMYEDMRLGAARRELSEVDRCREDLADLVDAHQRQRRCVGTGAGNRIHDRPRRVIRSASIETKETMSCQPSA